MKSGARGAIRTHEFLRNQFLYPSPSSKDKLTFIEQNIIISKFSVAKTSISDMT
jgi:hypothetical protein